MGWEIAYYMTSSHHCYRLIQRRALIQKLAAVNRPGLSLVNCNLEPKLSCEQSPRYYVTHNEK